MNEDKENIKKTKECYEYIVISQPIEKFSQEINQASKDGWEPVNFNTFPVQKPDYVTNSITITVVCTAILRRPKKFSDKGEKNG